MHNKQRSPLGFYRRSALGVLNGPVGPELCPLDSTYAYYDTFPVDGVPNTDTWVPQLIQYAMVVDGRLRNTSASVSPDVATKFLAFDFGIHTDLDVQGTLFTEGDRGFLDIGVRNGDGSLGAEDFSVDMSAYRDDDPGGLTGFGCRWDFGANAGLVVVAGTPVTGDVLSINVALSSGNYIVTWKLNGVQVHQLTQPIPLTSTALCYLSGFVQLGFYSSSFGTVRFFALDDYSLTATA